MNHIVNFVAAMVTIIMAFKFALPLFDQGYLTGAGIVLGILYFFYFFIRQ